MQRTIRCPAPVDVSRIQTLHSTLREYGRKKAEKFNSQRTRVSATRLCVFKMGKLYSRNVNIMVA